MTVAAGQSGRTCPRQRPLHSSLRRSERDEHTVPPHMPVKVFSSKRCFMGVMLSHPRLSVLVYLLFRVSLRRGDTGENGQDQLYWWNCPYRAIFAYRSEVSA